MKKFSALLLVAFFLGAVISVSDEKYPFVMWSEKAFDRPREFQGLVGSTQVIDQLKASAEATQMQNLIVVLKEGLTSKDLVSNARNFEYLKPKILEHSHAYTNVENGFSISEFERLIG